MKSMLARIRRWEAARGRVAAQENRRRAIAEAILAKRRELHGPGYKHPYEDLPPLPPTRTAAQAILQRRAQIMEYERAKREAQP